MPMGNVAVYAALLLEVFTPDKAGAVESGTVARGSATCPVTGFTTTLVSVRQQLKTRRGGAADARLVAVREVDAANGILTYRSPTCEDEEAVRDAAQRIADGGMCEEGGLAFVPNEPLPPQGTLGFRVELYGMLQWGDLFTPRQLLALGTIGHAIQEVAANIAEETDAGFAAAAECSARNCAWTTERFLVIAMHVEGRGEPCLNHTFSRQAIPMVWDFAETNPLNPTSASWMSMVDYLEKMILPQCVVSHVGQSHLASAIRHPLPDDIAGALITDPPYYDAVPYADLSDYFYVWLKRALPAEAGFTQMLTPKDEECIVDEVKGKDKAYFEHMMGCAFARGPTNPDTHRHRDCCLRPQINGRLGGSVAGNDQAGWVITGSWPIDTEQPTRLRAQASASRLVSTYMSAAPARLPSVPIMGETTASWFITVEGKEVERWRMQGCWE